MKRVKLKDLPIKWKRGAGLRKSDVIENGTNECVLYGELFTKYKEVKIDSRTLSKTDNSGTSLSMKGDVLVPGTSTASKDEMIRAREIDKDGVVIGGDINIIRPEPGIFAEKYLAYCFETQDAKRQLKKYITGSTGIIHISNSGLQNLEIPLPSIEEQEKIVSKLDAEFDRISRAEKLLKENLENVDKLQKSILSEAFKFDTDTHTHKLGDICTVKGGKRLPKGFALQKEPNGHPYIRVSDFDHNGSVDTSGIQYVPTRAWEQIKNYIVTVNDVFLSIAGSIGITGIVPEQLNMANLTENACRIIPNDIINKKYLYYFTLTNTFQRQANERKKTAAQPKLALVRIKDIDIPVPELDIQLSLVDKIEKQLNKTRLLSKKYNTELTKIANLRTQILAEAFSL